MRAFIERLRLVLDDRGMTQAELARRLGVGEATVSEWFTRGRVPQGDVLLRLPRVLAVGGHWLLTGEGPRYHDPDADARYERGARDVLDELADTIAELKRRRGR